MEYTEALDHLESLINYEVTPRAGKIKGLSLDRMRELMAVMGDPQTVYPAIHVTGTNGKGSTVRMIEALVSTMGLRVGTYSSPHLESPTERIRVAGASISDEDFGAVIGDVARTAEAHGFESLTWFETVTAAAFRHFANEAVDMAVVEVGMLGRFDATNVVDAVVSVVTNVGLDHTDGVGEWRRSIAAEKAGITRSGVPLVLGEADPDLRAEFEADGAAPVLVRDADFGVVSDQLAVGGRLLDLRTARGLREEVFLRLHGGHQSENAVLALSAVEEFFDTAIPDDVVTEAFDTVEAPGRLEVVGRSPLVLLDTAHNVPGAEALAHSLAHDFGEGHRRFLVIGMQDGRDPVAVCRALRVAEADLVVTCTAPTARGIASSGLAAAVAEAGGSAEAVSDVGEALDRVLALAGEDDMIVVVGSVTVVGDARRAMIGD